ncbi:polar amino acid ABC transporter inner membrane protein [Ketogulonicigenium robustum]|uniref:Polar amino acid ABC transporter inner membrane protein n=1 Tax=Ketogulonicigenium robustum TaxID=92947 RepID=A0A1W6NWQ2_9RHOB|nr:amino acid ABC transporter permease [Ketogulonicigenium robustum]ARO13629.1 polar amino acid ABC transporter inner membrane protein [Ketogulonicigenium robustum]
MSPQKTDNDFPWWLVILGVTGLWLLWRMLADPDYSAAVPVLAKGLGVTIMVTLVAFAGAAILGLGLALAQLSRHIALRQAARLYVEVMRGIPIMVLLLYIAFVAVPIGVEAWNALTGWTGIDPLRTRDVPLLWRAIAALMLAYASFLAEVFRAGILSVDQGQIEAAKALGLRPMQVFRHIVWPQAMRNVLPPLGNDFVAMVKDSSLVSVLGVADITQLAKLTAAANFRYLETYNVVALIYLTVTIGLSLLLRKFEQHLRARAAR